MSENVLSSMATISRLGAGRGSRRSKRLTIVSCSRPGRRSTSSAAPAAAAATTPATVTATARLRPRSARRMALLVVGGEVAVAGADDHRAVIDQVAHRDAALADAGQRAVAAILGVPGGAANGRDAVAAAGAERAAVVAAPQGAPVLLLPLVRDRSARVAAGTVRTGPAQLELGQALGLRGLADLEQAAVEDRALRVAAWERALERHAALAGVDERADRHRDDLRQRHEVVGSRHLDRDRAGALVDVDALAEHRRRGGGAAE